MKKHRELAAALLDKAAQDESLLDAVINMESVADEIFGFHAQQAMEKLLKGLLSFHNIRFGRVHNLRVLMDQLADATFPLPSDLQKIDVLTPYSVTFRYEALPFNNPLSRREMRDLVRQTREWVESEMTAH